MTSLRLGLPPLPGKMQRLKIDSRGYPVPWFVEWIDGEPDFRVISSTKWRRAVEHDVCWICGDKLGGYKVFVLGPMCAVNRTTSEPPCHRECADFAVQACPFMLLPKAQRREANLPAGTIEPPGIHLDRNPGVTALWTTASFTLFDAGDGRALIRIGSPDSIRWIAQGRDATRGECVASIMGGVPDLERAAREDSRPFLALSSLYSALDKTMWLLPKETT